jgi:hypothetical protein
MTLKMGMYFVSNKSHPRSNFGARPVTQPVVAPPTTPTQQPATPAPLLVAQSTSSIITRTRQRPNTSRFNMNDTFAARGRPCPRS